MRAKSWRSLKEQDLSAARDEQLMVLKDKFENIFDKYTKDFTDVGDVVNLETLDFEINNGHVAGAEHELDTGELGESEEDESAEVVDSEDELAAPSTDGTSPDVLSSPTQRLVARTSGTSRPFGADDEPSSGAVVQAPQSGAVLPLTPAQLAGMQQFGFSPDVLQVLGYGIAVRHLTETASNMGVPARHWSSPGVDFTARKLPVSKSIQRSTTLPDTSPIRGRSLWALDYHRDVPRAKRRKLNGSSLHVFEQTSESDESETYSEEDSEEPTDISRQNDRAGVATLARSSGRYSAEEDAKLIELRRHKKLSWEEITEHFPGRDRKSLENRYYNARYKPASLDSATETRGGRSSSRRGYVGRSELPDARSSVPVPQFKPAGTYTAEEDVKLFHLKRQRKLGWHEINAHFPNRDEQSLKNRYYNVLNKLETLECLRERHKRTSGLTAAPLVAPNGQSDTNVVLDSTTKGEAVAGSGVHRDASRRRKSRDPKPPDDNGNRQNVNDLRQSIDRMDSNANVSNVSQSTQELKCASSATTPVIRSKSLCRVQQYIEGHPGRAASQRKREISASVAEGPSPASSVKQKNRQRRSKHSLSLYAIPSQPLRKDILWDPVKDRMSPQVVVSSAVAVPLPFRPPSSLKAGSRRVTDIRRNIDAESEDELAL